MRTQALRLVQAGQHSSGEIARTLGISRETLRRWRKQAGRDQDQQRTPPVPVAPQEPTRLDATSAATQEDVRRLHHDNQRLRAERALLVEALVFVVMLVRGSRS